MKSLLKKIALSLTVVMGTISFPAFASTLENSSENDRNKQIVIEKGSVLTDSDFSEVYNVYEKSISDGAALTEEKVLSLIVEKIDFKLRNRYNIFGQSVTKEELKLVALHPIDASKVFNNSKSASSEANNLYRDTYLGNGDAFRHAYWNALNVKSVGLRRAYQFATAHESESADNNDRTMDMRNNDIGRTIGNNYSSSSNSTIKNQVISYVSNGRLWRVQNNRLIKTDSSGRR